MLRKIADFIKKIFRMEPIPTTVNTLREALQALEVARNHFENCDPEFVDAAIFELNAAECRVDAVRRCVGVKTFYKVFYYKNIELLAYPVGNEPNEEDEEIFSKTELAFDYDISADEIECRKELR